MPAHTLRAPKRRAPVEARDPDLLPVGPRTKVGRRFIYVHYESSWRFDAELGWLPKLSRLAAVPGVNGVGEDGNLQRAINGATAKGGIIIQPLDKRLLREGEDPEEAEFYRYGRYYDCANGDRWWVEPGMEPTITPAGRIIWNASEAERTIARMRAHIRDTGIVEPIHPLVIAEKVSNQRQSIESLQRSVALNPHLQGKLDRAIALLEAMQRPVASADPKAGRKIGKARRKSPTDG
jgi:hypothetical protein